MKMMKDTISFSAKNLRIRPRMISNLCIPVLISTFIGTMNMDYFVLDIMEKTICFFREIFFKKCSDQYLILTCSRSFRWPGGKLDRIIDNANYTCQSKSWQVSTLKDSSVSDVVSSTTYFRVECKFKKTTILWKIKLRFDFTKFFLNLMYYFRSAWKHWNIWKIYKCSWRWFARKDFMYSWSLPKG